MVGDGNPLYRAEDRVEIFADFVEARYRPNTAHNVQHVAKVERKLKLYLEQPIAPIQNSTILTSGQIQRMIRRTPLRKAPGPDWVNNVALCVTYHRD